VYDGGWAGQARQGMRQQMQMQGEMTLQKQQQQQMMYQQQRMMQMNPQQKQQGNIRMQPSPAMSKLEQTLLQQQLTATAGWDDDAEDARAHHALCSPTRIY
jgi:hypothetical protein